MNATATTLDLAAAKVAAANNTSLDQLDEAQLKEFIRLLQEKWNAYQAKQGYKLGTLYRYEYLKTYIRVYKCDDRSCYGEDNSEEKNRSLYAFIDCKGNIHKGSWKAPVKNGIRGNIFNDNPLQGMDIYGPVSLR